MLCGEMGIYVFFRAKMTYKAEECAEVFWLVNLVNTT